MNDFDWQSRTKLLLGETNHTKLKQAHVLIAGLGGVGAYAAEAFARAGIGTLTLLDSDVVTASNRNRQLLALNSNEGILKTELMAKRILDINPEIKLQTKAVYLKDEVIPKVLEDHYDYVVDAIDTLSPKIFFIKNCLERKLPLVSSMGAGGKLDPSKIRTGDISESHVCKFAQAVRKKLNTLGIKNGFQVVYSTEAVPKEAMIISDNSPNKKSTVGTISYMPAIFGLTLASLVIRDLIK